MAAAALHSFALSLRLIVKDVAGWLRSLYPIAKYCEVKVIKPA